MKNKKEKKKINFIDFILTILFSLSLIFIITAFLAEVYPYETNYYYNKYIKGVDAKTITINNKNEYYRNNDYIYVQNTKYLYPKNKKELLNVLYTFINSGQTDIKFYCPKEYKSCTKDAEGLIYNKKNTVVSKIYEFSHPFNDYKSISCGTDKDTGLVIYHLNKKYSNKKIKAINAEVDKLYQQLVNPDDDNVTNIRRIHDYLVNNIDYDKEKSNFIDKKSKDDSKYDSTTAYGALVQHKAICGGYTDAMYLFLDKMGIKTMRISSLTHIWNAVELDGKWYHIDLTWDDGKYTSGRSYLSHDYFLIDTPTLFSLDTKSHTFYDDVYLELVNK